MDLLQGPFADWYSRNPLLASIGFFAACAVISVVFWFALMVYPAKKLGATQPNPAPQARPARSADAPARTSREPATTSPLAAAVPVPSSPPTKLDLRMRTGGQIHFVERSRRIFVVVENLSITNRATRAVVLETEFSLEVRRGSRVFLQPVPVEQLPPQAPEIPRTGYLGPVVNVPASTAAQGHVAVVLERIVGDDVWPSVDDRMKSARVFSTLLLGVRDQLTGLTAEFRVPFDTAGP